MSDYSDWTESIELLGSEIMVPTDVQGAVIMLPLDIQGATIMMPMDIQGQNINLAVDIVAQTVGNIAIDISAQTIGNLNVNIAAQAGNVTINVAAQSVGIQLNPEWQVVQGTHKRLAAGGSNIAFGDSVTASYTVTAGKKLYITEFSGSNFVTDSAANANRAQGFFADIYNATTTTRLFSVGGSWGSAISFSQPKVVPAGQQVQVRIWQYGLAVNNIQAELIGYEV